jgi:MFS family permease
MGRRAATQMAILLAALGTLICGLSNDMNTLIIARFVSSMHGRVARYAQLIIPPAYWPWRKWHRYCHEVSAMLHSIIYTIDAISRVISSDMFSLRVSLVASGRPGFWLIASNSSLVALLRAWPAFSSVYVVNYLFFRHASYLVSSEWDSEVQLVELLAIGTLFPVCVYRPRTQCQIRLGWRWAFLLQTPCFLLPFVMVSVYLQYTTPVLFFHLLEYDRLLTAR